MDYALSTEIVVGQVRRRSMLGTHAYYRIVELSEASLVRVEVLAAPGLSVGARFTFTRDAISSCELMSASTALAVAA